MEFRVPHQKVDAFHALDLLLSISAMPSQALAPQRIRRRHSALELVCAQRLELGGRRIDAQCVVYRVKHIRHGNVFAVGGGDGDRPRKVRRGERDSGLRWINSGLAESR